MFRIDLCGRVVPAQNTEDGVRATQRVKPIDPGSVERYLEGRFRDDLKAVRSAMEKLARAYAPKELAEQAYLLYKAFRLEIPAGKSGWGAKGRCRNAPGSWETQSVPSELSAMDPRAPVV